MKLLLRMNQLYRLIDAARVRVQPWHEDIFYLRGEPVESYPEETFIESGDRHDRRLLYYFWQYW
jgi:hypothetical protein